MSVKATGIESRYLILTTGLLELLSIDNVKNRLPVWKKELYNNGEESWIESNHCGCSDPKNLLL